MSALAPLLAFPVVAWTVLVAISLVYWLFVMSGLVHLGEGMDGGAEGLGAGGTDVDLHADAHVDAGADGADGADAADGADGADGPGHHAAHGLLTVFRMRDVPITVQFTLIAFFAWVVSFVATWAMHRAGHDPTLLVRCLIAFVGAPLVAMPLAKVAARPLAPLLTTRHAKSSRDLIGKTCTIRTGEANETFGEAVVKDTGADLVLRVRVEGGALRRGEEGLIVGWDEEREEYLVQSMDEALGRGKPR